MLTSRDEELINAVENGNYDEVKKLIEEDGVDVNSVITSKLDKRAKRKLIKCDVTRVTPLSTAIHEKNPEIISYLLALGAKTKSYPDVWYEYSENPSTTYFTQSPLGLACVLEVPIPIFHILFRHVNNLQSVIHVMKNGSPYRYKYPEYFLQTNSLLKYEYLSLFIYEATLRGCKNTINRIAAKPVEHSKIQISGEGLEKHLSGRPLTRQEAKTAHATIDYLHELRFITLEILHELKSVVHAYTIQKIPKSLTVEDLPQELRQACEHMPSRSLKELFAEFRSLTFPEDRLPPILSNNPLFNKNQFDWSIEEIDRLQDPVALRFFLSLGDAEILKRIGSCINILDGYPAAELLAQIIVFKAEESIDVDGEKQNLLSPEQIERGLKLLIALYQLSSTQKLQLSLQARQTEFLQQFQDQVQQLVHATENMNRPSQDELLIKNIQALSQAVLEMKSNHQVMLEMISRLNSNQEAMINRVEQLSVNQTSLGQERKSEQQSKSVLKFF